MDEAAPAVEKARVAPWLALLVVLGAALVFAFGPGSINLFLDDLMGRDARRALRIFYRIWLLPAPASAIMGILVGYLILVRPWLTRAVVGILRIVRWAPLLVWWGFVAQLTINPPDLSPLWITTYVGVTVALTACYELLLARFVQKLSLKTAMTTAFRAATIQGLLVALILDMSVWMDLWYVSSDRAPFGLNVFIALAATILAINWAYGLSFERAAAERGAALLKELQSTNRSSFYGAVTIVAAFILAWEAASPAGPLKPPIEVLAALRELVSGWEFLQNICISLMEVFAGVLVGGSLAAFLVLALNNVRPLKIIPEVLLQISQVAPIALLPYLLFFHVVPAYQWSATCAAVFSFYSFARAFRGLRHERLLPRILLAVDEALPYGGIAIVYGEMMWSNAGVVFFTSVTMANREIAKGIAIFITWLLLIAALSILLRWAAKAPRHTPASQASLTPSSAAA